MDDGRNRRESVCVHCAALCVCVCVSGWSRIDMRLQYGKGSYPFPPSPHHSSGSSQVELAAVPAPRDLGTNRPNLSFYHPGKHHSSLFQACFLRLSHSTVPHVERHAVWSCRPGPCLACPSPAIRRVPSRHTMARASSLGRGEGGFVVADVCCTRAVCIQGAHSTEPPPSPLADL